MDQSSGAHPGTVGGAPTGTARTARSVSVEDYVKTIYTHTEWQPTPITGSALAAKLGLSPSSVTEMVQKLDRLGLVNHIRYGAVTLTPDGLTLALEMVRRHRLLETYLVQALGYAWEQVHDEAEVLEHVVSPLLLERIDAHLGRPHRDPHGDPIPDADGVVTHPTAVPLSTLGIGASGIVARISDVDPDLLVAFAGLSVELDAAVRVMGRSPAAAVSVRVGEETLDLDERAAAAVWVTVTSSAGG